jgi:hypothetical protein
MGTCTLCASRLWVILKTILVVSFTLLQLIYLIRKNARAPAATSGSKERDSTLEKILINHFQTLSLIATMPVDWPESTQEFFQIMIGLGGSFSFFSPIECLFHDSGEDLFS